MAQRPLKFIPKERGRLLHELVMERVHRRNHYAYQYSGGWGPELPHWDEFESREEAAVGGYLYDIGDR